MRVLHFADVHLDAAFAAFGPEVGSKRRAAVRETFERIIELAIERRVDAVFCAGDLFEQDRIAPDTIRFLCERFGRLGNTPVYIAPGNHDFCGALSPYRRGRFPDNVHVFDSDELTRIELAEGLVLWGAAFTTPRRETGFLDDFSVGGGDTHIALFHGSEVGAFQFDAAGQQLYAPFHAARIREAGLLHAFVGHNHAPADAGLFTYPGNPEPLRFGESAGTGAGAGAGGPPGAIAAGPLPRGVVIATIEPGYVRRERITVTRTRIQDIRFDVSGSTDATSLRSALEQRLEGETGYARVFLRGDLHPDVDLSRADIATVRGGLEAPPIFVHDGLFPAYDLDSLRDEQTVRGEFLRLVEAAEELDHDERRRIIVTGLRAFDRRDDLEVA